MRVVDVCYDDVTEAEGVARLQALRRGGEPAFVTYLNLDCLRLAHVQPEYRSMIDSATVVLPDGIGVRVATRLVGKRKRAHWNVTDFYLDFIAKAAAEGAGFFLLGSPDGVAAEAAEKLRESVPGIRICGTHTGYIKDHAAAVAAVNASGADVLLVGMGAPVQERWITQHKDVLKPTLRIGVGALFDWVSGRQKRAPRLVQALHLEWLWRVFLEPRRLFRRYIVNDLSFLLSVPFRQARVLPLEHDARA